MRSGLAAAASRFGHNQSLVTVRYGVGYVARFTRSTRARLYKQPDDFEAIIRIFSTDEGGRSTPPFNGIRWDFAYAEDDVSTTGLYMVWPDFVDDAGESLPTDRTLPIGLTLPARMTIVVDEMRSKLHQKRISVGTEFYCHEGSKRVAAGTVTRLTGLLAERSPTTRSMG